MNVFNLSLTHIVIIVIVGVMQGFLNTVAGGGSLLVLPVLTFTGMDLAAANGTNRVAILLQSVSGAASFKNQKILSMKTALPLAAVTTLGAIAGTCVAVQVDKRILNLVIGILISVMGVLLVMKPKLWEGRAHNKHPKWVAYGVFFLVGIYGGFIQAGVGFFFSGALTLVAGYDLVNGNALKTVIIGSYTTISLVIFYLNGMVNIPIGLLLAVGSMFGAILGAKFTVSKGNNWVRYVLTIVVIVSAAKMIFDAFR